MHLTELELLRDGAVVRVIRVGDEPVHLGRDLDNTVVLADEDVSGHHAVVTVRPDGAYVTDLRSTNGTWLGGVRVGEARLADGDELRLGISCRLRVRSLAAAPRVGYVLHDVTAGTVHPLRGDYAHVGSGVACLVRLPGGPTRLASVTVVEGRELWLDAEDGGRPLAVGEAFVVGGHELRVEPSPARADTTLSHDGGPFGDYALTVDLDAAGGPTATLRDDRRDAEHTVVGETRATLLYVLGRQRLAHRAEGRPEPAAGWMDDEDVLLAVWGRAAQRQAPSGYSVLLHRLRRELDAAGFDPSFLEKRRGATRLRLDAVDLGGGGV